MRYFFHVRDGDGSVADEEGSELDDITAAKREARESARDFVADALRGGPSILGRHIDIANASGVVLVSFPMTDVLH